MSMIVVVCHNSSVLVVVVTRSIHNESCVIYSYIYVCVYYIMFVKKKSTDSGRCCRHACDDVSGIYIHIYYNIQEYTHHTHI